MYAISSCATTRRITGMRAFWSLPPRVPVQLWEEVAALLQEERARGGIYDIDTHTISGIDAYAPGYIDKEKEQIVGLQTTAPLTRAVMPFGRHPYGA